MQKIPLCVDLDGTLIRTDLLHESVMQLIKLNPLYIFLLPFWLLKGRARLKSEIAARTRLRYASLPYNEDILALIGAARAEGRQVVLATASLRTQAQAVADHLGLFDSIEASEGSHNLSGRRKAQRLVELYGEHGFDYAGNGDTDLKVWEKSRRAIVVCEPGGLVDRARRVCGDVLHLPVPRAGARVYLKAIRLHQWLKNALIFVPLLAAHQLLQLDKLFAAMLAFLAFGLCASAVYVLNDLLDLEADRSHKSKRRRPFASGAIPIATGVLLFALLLGLSVVSLAWLPYQFALVLAAYFLATNLYSFWLKRQVIVDIMLLAILYTTRIVAGAAASDITLSFWLLAFSIFLFLSLGIVKRYTELRDAMASNIDRPIGRGYAVHDLPLLLNLGVGSGFASTLVFALFINSPETNLAYGQHEYLWPAVLAMLYWTIRVWMKTHRGEIHDDPVVFAVSDKQSWIVLAIMLTFFYLAR